MYLRAAKKEMMILTEVIYVNKNYNNNSNIYLLGINNKQSHFLSPTSSLNGT